MEQVDERRLAENPAPSRRVRRTGPEADAILEAIRDVWAARHLLNSFIVREMRVRYKQTVLGLAWAVVHPLGLMAALTLVFGRIVRVDSEGAPYWMFSYAALLPWTFFQTTMQLSTNALVKDVELVTRIWFPREVLPLATIAASLLDFMISFALFLALLIYMGQPPDANVLYIVPLIALQLTLITGLSLFTCAINVRFRDVKFIVPLALQLWMFASPVIYSVRHVPERYRDLFSLNPLVGLIDGYRAVLLHHVAPDLKMLGFSALGAFVILLLGWWYFHRVERHFADVI